MQTLMNNPIHCFYRAVVEVSRVGSWLISVNRREYKFYSYEADTLKKITVILAHSEKWNKTGGKKLTIDELLGSITTLNKYRLSMRV